MYTAQKIIFGLFFSFIISFCFILEGGAESKIKKSVNSELSSELDAQPIYWYESGIKKIAWMAKDEVAVFLKEGEAGLLNADVLAQQFHPQAKVTGKNSFVIYLKSPETIGREQILGKSSSLRTLQGVKRVCPVFYTSKDKSPGSRIVPTGEIIVKFPTEYTENQITAIEKNHGLLRLKSFDFAENTFLYEAGDPLNSLDIANRIYESGQAKYAYPNWQRKYALQATPNDTYFPWQWHLKNTGQTFGIPGEDVNITSVWDTYRGSSNEVIGIVDSGVEIGHEDLKDNVVPGKSHDYVDGDSDPTPTDTWDYSVAHGTCVAGVSAGKGFNGLGITGAAPNARIVGYRIIETGADTDANIADALTRNNNLVDIYNNSWGPGQDYIIGLHVLPDLSNDALVNGVTNGRGGLGSIFVFAAGNFDEHGDNANYNGIANSRYTIAVAASNNFGKHSSYSDQGACIVVNAPSSGGSDEGTLGITTTDIMGYNGFSFINNWINNDNYYDSFGGTSSAAPLVSGIIALMLQANPNLTWRDVQHILIETAEKNDPTDLDWKINGAGKHINHKYGFGRIDAQAAVNAARTWQTVVPDFSTQGSSSPNLPIPDNDQTGVSDTISIPRDITIDFVEVYFTANDHLYWGDLEVTLISPSGTESRLSEFHGSAIPTDTYNNWRFGSVFHYGESSKGNWTLKVKDLGATITGTFQSWTIKIYGTASTLTAPSSLAARATSSSSIVLSWRDKSNHETGFKIERKAGTCASSNSWSQIATVGANVITYTDTGLSPGTTYAYRVRAYNGGGNSAYTSCTSTATGVFGSPNSPTNLNAVSTSASRINLSWNDNSTDETRFKIYRRVGAGTWNLLATPGINARSYSDTGNTDATSYVYCMRACNNSGCSPDTYVAVVPYSPTTLSVPAVSSGEINLSWTDRSSNETGFQIQRKAGVCSSTNSWSQIASVGANITSYSNNIGLSSGTTYSYRVRSYTRSSAQPYAYGYALWSNCVEATTP